LLQRRPDPQRLALLTVRELAEQPSKAPALQWHTVESEAVEEMWQSPIAL
jgi:hypothetical protein